MPPRWPPLCTSGASDGVSCGRVGRCFGLKKQKDRPQAAEIMSTTPNLPHLNFRCRIVGEVSSEPLPRRGGVGDARSPRCRYAQALRTALSDVDACVSSKGWRTGRSDSESNLDTHSPIVQQLDYQCP